MTQAQRLALVMRLAAAFPRDHVTESTVTLFATELALCDMDALTSVIEGLINGAKEFPTLAEIRENYRNARAREPEPLALPMGRVPMPPEVKAEWENLKARMKARSEELDEEAS